MSDNNAGEYKVSLGIQKRITLRKKENPELRINYNRLSTLWTIGTISFTVSWIVPYDITKAKCDNYDNKIDNYPDVKEITFKGKITDILIELFTQFKYDKSLETILNEISAPHLFDCKISYARFDDKNQFVSVMQNFAKEVTVIHFKDCGHDESKTVHFAGWNVVIPVADYDHEKFVRVEDNNIYFGNIAIKMPSKRDDCVKIFQRLLNINVMSHTMTLK